MALDDGVLYLRIDEPGLSLARNVALERTGTPWLVYLDDDTTPHQDWAEGILQALLTVPDDVAMLGGRIHPVTPPCLPREHITEDWLLLLSCVEDAEGGDVGAGKNICGANLAVRKDAVTAVGGFPSQLGRIGSRLISCEESFVIERLRGKGLRACYDPRFAVDHHIPSDRLRSEWAVGRAFWEGVS